MILHMEFPKAAVVLRTVVDGGKPRWYIMVVEGLRLLLVVILTLLVDVVDNRNRRINNGAPFVFIVLHAIALYFG